VLYVLKEFKNRMLTLLLQRVMIHEMNGYSGPCHLEGMEEKVHYLYPYLHLTRFCIVHACTKMAFARLKNHSLTQTNLQTHP
jgi:hypothetical protein